jgi:hypothetical protein
MKTKIKGILVFILMAGFVTGLFAQQREAQQPRPELEKEMVKLNYIRADKVHKLLLAYQSRYGHITFDNDLNIITLSDTPEIIVKMLDVIKELDAPPVSLIFTVDIIMGYKQYKAEKDDKELKSDPLIKELKKLLNYACFERIDTSFIRVQDGRRTRQRVGGNNLSMRLQMIPRYIKDARGETIQVELDLEHIQERKQFAPDGKTIVPSPSYITLLETSVPMKSGDRTVVGVSKLNGGDTGLILILHGKVDK